MSFAIFPYCELGFSEGGELGSGLTRDLLTADPILSAEARIEELGLVAVKVKVIKALAVPD